MSQVETTQPKGERLRKALRWLSESQSERPNSKRLTIVREAVIRFDLTPKESAFLEKNFAELIASNETD